MDAASVITPCSQCPLSKEKSVDELLTLEQAATKVKISIRKIQLDKAAGSIAYVKFGRLTRFRPCDIEEYILSRLVPARRNTR